jgi:hypothetical protein
MKYQTARFIADQIVEEVNEFSGKCGGEILI